MIFQYVVCIGIIILIFGYIAHAIVVALTEAFDKPLPGWLWFPSRAVVFFLLVGLFALLSKSCSPAEEEVAPNGQTVMEHYEPRW